MNSLLYPSSSNQMLGHSRPREMLPPSLHTTPAVRDELPIQGAQRHPKPFKVCNLRTMCVLRVKGHIPRARMVPKLIRMVSDKDS